MTSQMAIRWTMALGMLLVGTAPAQQAPAVNKTQEQTPAIKAEQKAAATNKIQQEGPTIQSRKDKLSYAFGVDLARGLKWQRVDVDVDLVVRALRDELAGNKLLMADNDVTATLKTFEEERK